MSNIIKSNDDFLYLDSFISYIYKKGISKDALESFLYYFIPKDGENSLINFTVHDKGSITAMFFPTYRNITFSIDKINKWILVNFKYFNEKFDVKDEKLLKCFLCLFIITHEIEHSYQFLMSKGEFISYPVIQELYNRLFSLLEKKHFIIPRPIVQTRRTISQILYKLKEDFYVLERNANIFSTDLLYQCAYFIEREDLADIFFYLRNYFLTIGYNNNTKGSFDETFQSILMYDKFNKIMKLDTVFDINDRVILGLDINENVRQKVITRQFFERRI